MSALDQRSKPRAGVPMPTHAQPMRHGCSHPPMPAPVGGGRGGGAGPGIGRYPSPAWAWVSNN